MQFKVILVALLGSAFAQQAAFTQQLTLIHHALDSLDASVKGISAGGNLAAATAAITAKSDAVVAAINTATTTLAAATALDVEGAATLVKPSHHLVEETVATINDLIAKKAVIASANAVGTVLAQLKTQQAAAQKLIATISAKVPADTKAVTADIGAQIDAAIAKGLAAFA